MSASQPSLSDIPSELLKPGERAARALLRWCEREGCRPSFWDIHEEAVRRGVRPSYDRQAVEAALRGRISGRRAKRESSTPGPSRRERRAA